MPYRIPSPPPRDEPEGDHPYVAVLLATRRRTRVFTGLVVVGLAGLSVLIWHRPPTGNNPHAAWERQDQLARTTIAQDRKEIAYEQMVFERTVREATKDDRTMDTGCQVRLETDGARFGPSFPLLVVRDAELVDELPSQLLASMLADLTRAEFLVSTSRPANALGVLNSLGPGRLQQEVVLVTSEHVVPKVRSNGAYEPGHIKGTAYIYDFTHHSVVCKGAIEASSSPSIGYAYATNVDALPGASAEASMTATLEEDLRRNAMRAIAKNVKGL